MQSCIMTTVMQEIEDTVTSQSKHYITKGENLKEGLLTLQIDNNAENTMLQISSLEICNIQLADSTEDFSHNNSSTYTGAITLINSKVQLQYGSGTSTTYYNTPLKIKIPAQKLTPWNPAELTTMSSYTYAKIHGTMYTYLTNNDLLPLYSGIMYYPISGEIPAITGDNTNISPTPITINLQPNCPLYAIINGIPQKILHPITFTVTVDDWK